MKSLLIYASCLTLLFSCAQITAQKTPANIPVVHLGIMHDDSGYYILAKGKKIYEYQAPAPYTLNQLMGNPQGTDTGIDFDFQNVEGKMYYGFIPYGDSKHPHPVYFRRSVPIEAGKATIDIATQMKGRYDMVGWEASGKGTLGYRIVDQTGQFLYDGIVTFKGSGPFEVDVTMVEGPFINLHNDQGATISFTLNRPEIASVTVNGSEFSASASTRHEIQISGLEADRQYDYQINIGGQSYTYQMRTAPTPGTRKAFTFSYASDSRSGNGGGERNMWGANFYIMKRIMALNKAKEVAFMQFSGDLIDGYLTQPEAMDVQYANWKRAIQPFAHYFPVYISMGNHEALDRLFSSREDGVYVMLDRFPYETESGERIFANNFTNPENGPISEDGAVYDPDKQQQNFPSYKENVFYYTHDNVGVVVLNSDYWYSPSTRSIPSVGGGLHGYIMDNQLEWLAGVLEDFEQNDNIDHVFITQHTPFFPNGGHVGDDMWYRGDNSFRPYVAGSPLEKGIIERRDQLLDLLVNKSSKVIAILTGDEHNYARTEIGPQTVIHPENYQPEKVTLSRTIYQVNNGAAGAPYYAQEQTPWTPFVSSFTTQNALVLFHINGKELTMEVVNPDTLEKFDELKMR